MTCRVAVQRTWSNRYSTSSRNTPSRTTWLHTDGSPPKRHRLHSGVTPHIWGLGVSEKRRNPRLARENPDHVSTNTAHMAFSRGLATVDSRFDSSRHCPKNPPQRSTVCRIYLIPFRGLRATSQLARICIGLWPFVWRRRAHVRLAMSFCARARILMHGCRPLSPAPHMRTAASLASLDYKTRLLVCHWTKLTRQLFFIQESYPPSSLLQILGVFDPAYTYLQYDQQP
jgi:hypothetical protein